jgi:hypothetical protein
MSIKTMKHTHHFIESYDGIIGFGFNRETDERTISYYLQKFSDDALMENLLKKLSDQELKELFDIMTRLLKKHLSDAEYHRLFLKDE